MRQINGNEFQTVINDNPTVLVDFYSQSCGPCKIVVPMLESMEPERRDVTFVKVDAGVERELAESLNIMSVPTLILYRGGEEVARGVGINGVNEVVGKLR